MEKKLRRSPRIQESERQKERQEKRQKAISGWNEYYADVSESESESECGPECECNSDTKSDSGKNISSKLRRIFATLQSIEKFQILLANSVPAKKTAIAGKLIELQKLNEDQAFHQEEIDKIESKKRKC